MPEPSLLPALSGRRRLALAGLVALSLLASAAVRPVWRALDPALAARVAVLEALESDTPLDPWGSPWAELSGVPARMGGAREPVRASAGPDRRLGEGGDDVWVGAWSDDLAQRRLTLDSQWGLLPHAYRDPWHPVLWGWWLALGLWLADRLLRLPGRTRLERIGLLAFASGGAAVLGLLIAGTLLRGDAGWQPFPARGWGPLDPHLLPELPAPLRPTLPRAAFAFGLLVGVTLLLRERAARQARRDREAAPAGQDLPAEATPPG